MQEIQRLYNKNFSRNDELSNRTNEIISRYIEILSRYSKMIYLMQEITHRYI